MSYILFSNNYKNKFKFITKRDIAQNYFNYKIKSSHR